MTAALSLSRARAGYRHATLDPEQRKVGELLQQASEALNLAVLTSTGDIGDEGGDRLRRAAQARSFLLEACQALSRARVHLPSLRSLAPGVVLSPERRAGDEIARIHGAAIRLLWANHAYLPSRSEAKPLPPEEEAQLAVVVAGVARSARIDRALRHRWCGVALLVAIAAMAAGNLLIGAVATVLGMALVAFRLWRPHLGATGHPTAG